MARRALTVLALLFVLGWPHGSPFFAQEGAARRSALVWVGKNAEYEAFIRDTPFVEVKPVPIGVTKPKRGYFAPGGLVESVAWKVLPPGIRKGYWESYKSEIAAYEMDKLLEMNLVPPTVEKTWDGEVGAAILWVSPTHPWKDIESKPRPPEWDLQAIQMKMFDDLIGNKDRNAGNFLTDDEWHLFLIDHSRAFDRSKDLPWPLVHADRRLWDRMLALDQEKVDGAIGTLIGDRERQAIIQRRDKMKTVIDALVKKKGAAAVFTGR